MSAPLADRSRDRAGRVFGRIMLVVLAAIGLAFVGYAFVGLHDVSWRVWPLSLLLCALAVFCWSITAVCWRGTRKADRAPHIEQPDPAGTSEL